MLTLPLLLHQLAGHVIRAPADLDHHLGIGKVIVLGSLDICYDTGCVYVGTPADKVPTPPETGPVLPVLYACAGSDADLSSLVGVCTDLALSALLNCVLSALEADRQWTNVTKKALQGGTLHSILAACCQDTGLHAAIMNPGYRLLGEFGCAGSADVYLSELNANGYLSFQSMQKLEELTNGQDSVVFASPVPGGRMLLQSLGSGGFSVARLLLYCDDGTEDYLVAWADNLAFCLREYFLGGGDGTADTEFGSFLGDLIEGRITDTAEIEERLKRIKMFGRDRYRIVLVFFPYRMYMHADETEENVRSIPWNYIINLLTKVFPFSNGAVYRGKILLTVRMHPGKSRLWYDESLLVEILRRYNGYAAISNTSKFISSLRSIYHQTNATLRLALAMNANPEQRIFRYEDYSVYHVIEMCAATASEYYGTNLVYLCHPAFSTILRHDQEHGVNLSSVLIAYLKNERNVTRTAQQLHIHRNTMMYKVQVIENIIGTSLDESSIRERILFSYHVMEFMQKYMHRDVLDVRGSLEKENID